MPTHSLPHNTGDLILDNCDTLGFNPPNSRQVLRIALNLKYVIDNAVPIIYEIDEITSEKSEIVNGKVLEFAYQACGGDSGNKLSLQKYQAVLIFALLNLAKWYDTLANQELSNFKLYQTRSIATQRLCRMVIDKEEKQRLHFLFMQLLLRRYVINENDKDSEPMNSVELATDMHYTLVIGSSGFQRCLKWLWRGWIVQSRRDPTMFIKDDIVSSPHLFEHFNPNRIKTPKYQNILQIGFAILFLVLYTAVVNDKGGVEVEPIDPFELFFYLFTTGYVVDELVKFYYIGAPYFSFWNCYNNTLYGLIMTSMVIRFMSLNPYKLLNYSPEQLDSISYRILSCAAPLVWSRLLLYLETERFVGIMLVVLKHMMAESIVFFVLLFLIMIGFLQGFLGLDSADGKREISGPILSNLLITVLGEGSFQMFENFAPPYAGILYYTYSFIVTVILLNILIAFYANAYQVVVDNADDEYMALMSQKTLRFIRAPDEDVYVTPLNLIEVLFIPIMRLLPSSKSSDLSSFIMTVLYSPMLLYVSIKEVRQARRIKYNRIKKLPDDANEIDTIWDLTDGFFDSETSNIFSSNTSSGIAATQNRTQESLRLQREVEQTDEHFAVPKKWYKKVRKAVNKSIVEEEQSAKDVYEELNHKFESQNKAIKELSDKISYLTELVKNLQN
ncbi:hypothetical protein KAFR_0J01840 [Kazachstania africana CBS 2517]|uniref:Ion transport domain-containing protein n=1 Tax=Kazachstania africana (strain ATCC 22294 / BCRC 22015 / CBS 2517 / CECT 1963 / NBRC 1671 / NRRL Y-8276) TaxID=1071382 RepID=H2B0U8_KAZAF|nr:hypothetical protein KAFR_0J01840 [Kazachstania africana CBS 2517]CCF60248.1 hypothetical protein KAFR_0J01840 [Kazachstania africana CBS 2517]